MINIDCNSYRAKAFNPRVRFVVLHYTAANFSDSISALTGKNVSSHYLVPNIEDKSYIAAGFKEMRVFNLVPESDRAWHAGVSTWEKRTGLNDSSIGIEIINKASFQNGKFTFPPYPSSQIDAIISLINTILPRYPDVIPTNIVGHSDIAVGRKSDPGPGFPWKKLYDAGIGAWYDERVKDRFFAQFRKSAPDRSTVISMLNKYGYDTDNAKTDKGFNDLIRAFQIHFRPNDHCGRVDNETAAILAALIEKYRKQ